MGRIPPEQEVKDRGDREGGAVDQRCGALPRFGDVFGKERGREGDKADAKQEQGVEDDEALVGTGQKAEDVAVIGPPRAAPPLAGLFRLSDQLPDHWSHQEVALALAWLEVGYLDLENQQGNSDREYPVAKGL